MSALLNAKAGTGNSIKLMLAVKLASLKGFTRLPRQNVVFFKSSFFYILLAVKWCDFEERIARARMIFQNTFLKIDSSTSS